MKALERRFSPSAELTHQTTTTVPQSSTFRPLRDVLIVEPLDAKLSAVIQVINECKPVRGIVRAVGPGHYPAVYLDKWGDKLPDHRRKERKQMTYSSHFQPTTVKVGDIVHLGGLEQNGYAFDSFVHGTKLMIICREADVAGIETDGTITAANLVRRRA